DQKIRSVRPFALAKRALGGRPTRGLGKGGGSAEEKKTGFRKIGIRAGGLFGAQGPLSSPPFPGNHRLRYGAITALRLGGKARPGIWKQAWHRMASVTATLVESEDPGSVTLTAAGEWLVGAAADLDRRLRALDVPKDRQVTLDLAGIDRLD